MTIADKIALGLLIAQLMTATLILLQLGVMTRQNKQLALSLEASTFTKLIIDYLQKPEEVIARKRVYEIHVNKIPFEDWSLNNDDRSMADRVLRSYEMIGIMTRRHLLDEGMVMAMWGRRAIMIDETLSKYRDEIRAQMRDPDSYENSRWLADSARKTYAEESAADKSHHEKARALKWR